MMEMVNGSRIGVAMMGLGIARRSFLESAIWAHQHTAKARLTRFGVEASTFAVELYGGNGYCEDFGLTRQLQGGCVRRG